MITDLNSAKINGRELAWSLLIVVLFEFVLYVFVADTLSARNFVESVAEIFLAPFYPGAFLVYPTVVVAFLIGSFIYSRLASSRWLRITLYVAALTLWVTIGLFTIIKWYH